MVALHKNNHGNTFSGNSQRDGKILRFLVQTSSWLMSKFRGLKDFAPRMSKEMRERQQQDMIINQSCRRIWLKANGESQAVDTDSDAHSWHVRNRRLSLADHLFPLFIWISGDLFEISKTPRLSLEWMKLATQFMVQAAIDILEEPDLLASGPDVVHNLLQECFAWGSLDEPLSLPSVETIIGKLNMRGFMDIDTTAIDYVTTMEARCQDMFKNSEMKQRLSGGFSFSDSQAQIWKNVKQEALEDVLMTLTSIQEAEEDLAHRPIELLQMRYPLAALLTDITDFITVHWKLLHSKAWHGKPVLVQIEEGGIDGLTSAEFEDFKDRADIRDMWSPPPAAHED